MMKRSLLFIALGFGIVAGAVDGAETAWSLDGVPDNIFLARLQMIRQAIGVRVLKTPIYKTCPQTTGLNFSHILRLSERTVSVRRLMQNPTLNAAELKTAAEADTGPEAPWILSAMLDHPQTHIRIEAARLLASPKHCHPIAATALLAAVKRNNYPLAGRQVDSELPYRKALWIALEKLTEIKLAPNKPRATTGPACVLPPEIFAKLNRWTVDVLAGQRIECSVILKVEAKGAPCLLNLDTNRIDEPASDIQGQSAQLDWYTQIGLDLICRVRKTDKGARAVLEGVNLKTVPFTPPKQPDTTSLKGTSSHKIRELLKGSKQSSSVLPDAFVFQTDTGRAGVLKITRADKNGISLRYMIDSRHAQTARESILKPPAKPSPVEAAARKPKTVRRFKAFDRMLQKNGFAVTPEQFPQIFTAYIPDRGRENALPPFITTDSAWETYHVLLEEGVKQLEQYQAVRLAVFSRKLLARATKLAANGQADFAKIAEYASIALALQDKKHAASVPNTRKQLLTALKNGTGIVRGPVGFPLSAAAFRANSFYTSSPKLADYFSARQWYAMVVFPANDKVATSLAVRLAMLIDSDKELRRLWCALSEPYDLLLAKAKDGDVAAYASAVRKIVGPKATDAQAVESIEALQKHLQTALPDPQINDQLLDQKQFDNFATLIKGFRLLPPRRLTSSVCFQKTTPPDSSFPSALNFMVACKQMRSPAAVRALQQQAGEKEARRIQQIDPGKLPDSLHGRAMKLIATLQKPPPAAAPKAMKTQAWSDKQLWTQLGAWAQQRHTWALHTKMSVSVFGGPEPSDAGMVSPYPDFFKSLGALARQTAGALPSNEIDTKALSKSLLHHIRTYTAYLDDIEHELTDPEMERMRAEAPELKRISDLLDECRNKHQTLLGFSKPASDARILKRIGDLARKCSEADKASKREMIILREFARSGDHIVDLMGQFADICDKLASIARKQLARSPLNKKENRLIWNYGPTLARLHFYERFSSVIPLDDFPIISPIFVNPRTGRTMYAALGRPHALYVLAKLNGQTKLMRGAVLSYREFTHPISQPLDDEAWQEIVRSGKPIPQPPTFTRSFIVHPGQDEIVDMLKRGEIYSGIDNVPGAKITQAIIALLPKAGREIKESLIWRLRNRGTEQDAAAFLKLMREYTENPTEKQLEIARDIIALTADTPCEAIAPELMKMLTAKNVNHANAAAVVLFYQPNLIDVSLITQAYDKLSAPRRTLACLLLGRLPKPSQAAIATMLKALQDKNASLRWHGATALGRSGAKEPTVITALSKRINDSNDYVASASLDALAKLGVDVDANILIDKLKRYCGTPNWTEADKSAEKAIETPKQGPFCVLARKPFYMTPYPDHLDDTIVTALIQMKCKRAVPVILEIITSDEFSSNFGFTALKTLDRSNYENHLADIALNDKLDADLRSAALTELTYADHPTRVCRRLTPLLGDKTKVSPGLFELKSRTLGDVAIISMAEILFPKEYRERYDDKSGVGMFDPDRPDDNADKKRFERLAKLVRKWAKTTTQPALN